MKELSLELYGRAATIIREGNRSKLEQFLDEISKHMDEPSEIEDWIWGDDGDGSILTEAAKYGNLEMVRMLMPLVLAHEESDLFIQHAFDACTTVDCCHTEIGELLLDAGADESYALDGCDDENCERCPVCLALCSPGAMDTCEHYVCSSSDGYIIWPNRVADFSEEVSKVASIVDELSREDPDPVEEALPNAPPDIRSALESAKSDESWWWCEDSLFQTHQEQPLGMLSSSGDAFYHSDPQFAKHVKERAQAVLNWLEANVSIQD